MNSIMLNIANLAVLLCIAAGHSQLSYPKPMSSRECRLGGMDPGPIRTCPGPCDTRAVLQNPNIKGPSEPSAVWGRGDHVTIKYQRNNHGPGGFVRLSIVPIRMMMSKTAHARNAIHYSCWGGGTVAAQASEIPKDRDGFSLTGSDGTDHNLPISYYSVNVTVPAVIPDGIYALGWAWYGGVGGTIFKNTPQTPFPNGFFSDMWSCSFVQIQGGKPIEKVYRPVFASNLSEFWGERCWSAHDSPGGCTYGPCRKPKASFLKPRPFKDGGKPQALKPYMFKSPSSCSEKGRAIGAACNPGPVPKPVSTERVAREAILELLRVRGEI